MFQLLLLFQCCFPYNRTNDKESEYCDRIMIQDHGKMLIIGSTDEIREKLHKPGANMDSMFIDIVNQARARGEEAAQ